MELIFFLRSFPSLFMSLPFGSPSYSLPPVGDRDTKADGGFALSKIAYLRWAHVAMVVLQRL